MCNMYLYILLFWVQTHAHIIQNYVSFIFMRVFIYKSQYMYILKTGKLVA